MALYEIPAEVLRDLLINIDGDIAAASPFAFLLNDDVKGDLDPHLPWLEKYGLLDSPSEQDGRLAILPGLRRALDIAARPIRRIVLSEIGPELRKRSVHVSDGAEVVVASFDEHNCILSDPVGLEAFRDGVVGLVALAQPEAEAPRPYQLHPAVLAFLGAVSGPWVVEDGRSPEVAGLDSALAWPVDRAKAEARLAALLDNPETAGEVIDNLVEDQILEASDGKLDIHPAFQVWHRAINSADFLEIRRQEIPESDLSQMQTPVHGLFLGAAGERCLVWPASDQPEEMLLSLPSEEELKQIVGFLVGWIDQG